MILKEYMKYLNKFVKDNPECFNMLVVYSIDDEGNGFHPVTCKPNKGYYEDNSFVTSDSCSNTNRDNAVCLN